jgi:hypothetical protein
VTTDQSSGTGSDDHARAQTITLTFWGTDQQRQDLCAEIRDAFPRLGPEKLSTVEADADELDAVRSRRYAKSQQGPHVLCRPQPQFYTVRTTEWFAGGQLHGDERRLRPRTARSFPERRGLLLKQP